MCVAVLAAAVTELQPQRQGSVSIGRSSRSSSSGSGPAAAAAAEAGSRDNDGSSSSSRDSHSDGNVKIPDFSAKFPKLSAKLSKLSANWKVHYLARHIPAEAYIIPRHDHAGPCASSSVTDTDVQQYSTDSSGAFSVGGHAHAHILGPARSQDCSDWPNDCKLCFKHNHLILICIQ